MKSVLTDTHPPLASQSTDAVDAVAGALVPNSVEVVSGGVCRLGMGAWPLPAWLDTLCGAGLAACAYVFGRLLTHPTGPLFTILLGVTLVGVAWIGWGWWRQAIVGKLVTLTLLSLMVTLIAVFDARLVGTPRDWPIWVWLLPLWLLLVATTTAVVAWRTTMS